MKLFFRTLNCHCNIEIIASVSSIKYLLKYMLKGNYLAAVEINNNKKISQYGIVRYIGTSKTVSIHKRELAIVRLQVHLTDKLRILLRNKDRYGCQ